MPAFVLFFLIGVLTSFLFKQIPCVAVIFFIFLGGIVCVINRNKLYPLGMVCLGSAWALLYAHFITSWSLPATLENQRVSVQGYIASIPITQSQFTTFNFKMMQVEGHSVHVLIKLHCPHCLYNFKVGDSWRLVTKLRKPHTLMNPGSFDSERQYFQQHIRALGTVICNNKNQLLTSKLSHYPIQRVREYILIKIHTLLRNNPFCGIVLALILGVTAYISSSQWQVFRITGTGHLVAISGLHIGLVAMLFAKIAGMIWNRLPNAPLYIPTLQIQASAGVAAAIIYSILAGLSPSTQRALIMIIFMLASIIFQRHLTPFRSLLFALGVIIVIDPFATLLCGFWLSFIAVFLLLYGMSARLSAPKGWWKFGRAQGVITIGMMPTVLFFFQQTSPLSIPANLIAIPWISFLVVPSCLIGMVCLMISAKLGTPILKFSLLLLLWIWGLLEKLAQFTVIIFHAYLNNTIAILSHMASYIFLLPTGMMHRWMAALWSLPLFVFEPAIIPANSLQLTVFDVGQGLATMIRTPHHVLIFDTGAKLSEDFDMGKRVILPYLSRLGLKKIDVLTVSHGDNDHRGGAQSLLKSLQVASIITSVPQHFKDQQPQNCWENMTWKWDGVTFTFLSPVKDRSLKGNNASCVLKITQGKQGILLTGDIEKEAEDLLIERHLKELAATILVVPHHGSNTSSSDNFIKAVSPLYAIFSCGYLNSYHHPHPDVLHRYKSQRVTTFNTVFSGAITMTLFPDSDMVTIKEFRQKQRKIWHQ
ncbi:MAG: DNA internalization-related competence protein ComEC/Rec2 [Gammaproteobacteria bacterium]|nr:DNA internalization-related competence protein ComEC/Rec2 [Gammaproteobacteria bacterium]